MRALRWFTVAVVTGAVLFAPGVASANGGAYIDFGSTHFLPGETATGVASVAVPERRQALFERGPFYAYLLTGRAWVREGRAIPDGAIRVGTLSVEDAGRDVFDLRVSFTVPELDGDRYSVAICNDPCTVSGFRDQLSGVVSVVETERERELLIANAKLTSRRTAAKREARRIERASEAADQALAVAQQDNAWLAGEVNRLRDEVRAAEATSTTSGNERPLIEPWATAPIGIGLLTLGAALARRRRAAAPMVAPTALR